MLGDLQAEGHLDSSGHFTLNLAQAMEKLKAYQLAQPHFYVLNLVASAVAGGARQLDVYTDADDTILTYDGLVPEAFHLRELFTGLFASQADPVWRELALGLHGARSLDPSRITVQAWVGSRGAYLKLDEHCLTAGPLSTCPWPDGRSQTRVHVHERVGLRTAGKLLTKLSGGLTPEAEVVLRDCRQAPLALSLNGLPINRTESLGACKTLLLWTQEGVSPPYNCQSTPRILEQPSPGNYYGVLGVGPTGPSHHPLKIVLQGVAFTVNPRRHLGGLRGILWARDLQKDLSQAQLVEDESYRGLMEQVEEAHRKLWSAGP